MSLPLGYGSILTRVFNSTETQVFEGVTAFSYLHSEKVDDSSRIVIETADVSIVDHPDLQEGKVLVVVFGYTNKLRKHKVWIWDVHATFSETGLRLEIVAYCKAAYMKLNSSKEVFNNATLKDMNDAFAAQYGMNPKTENITPGDQPPPNADVFQNTQLSKSVLNIGVGDGNRSPKATISMPSESSVYKTPTYLFHKHDTLPQANASDAQQIKKAAALEPTDNLIVEGHDDDLIIKKRNLLQKPFKSYIYRGEPGYLLEFVPAVKNATKRKSAVASNVQWWNAEDKQFQEGVMDAFSTAAPALAPEQEVSIDTLKKIAKETGTTIATSKENIIAIALSEQAKAKGLPGVPNIQIEDVKINLENGKSWAFDRYGVPARREIIDFNLKHPQVQAAVDNTALTFPIAFPKENLPATAVEPDQKKAAGVAENRLSKQQTEINECNATILGDPELRSGRVITIMGVGKRFSGNYYLISVDHNFSTSKGYVCDCVMFRNGKAKMSDEQAYHLNTQYLGKELNTNPGIPNDGTAELKDIPITKD